MSRLSELHLDGDYLAIVSRRIWAACCFQVFTVGRIWVSAEADPTQAAPSRGASASAR